LIAELRLRLVLGQSDQALPRVESALRSAEAAGRRRRALRLQFLHAQMLQAAGRRSEATAAFNSAILNAAARGMARVLADDAWTTESLVSRAEVAAEPRAVALLRELTARSASSDLQGSRETSREGNGAALRLTSRETQILRLVWKGHSNKAIARDLFLTENTIETHLRRIYEKLGTRKRTHAAALAREAGVI
jgi:LuxR family maltose regulon positive regulatory protein